MLQTSRACSRTDWEIDFKGDVFNGIQDAEKAMSGSTSELTPRRPWRATLTSLRAAAANWLGHAGHVLYPGLRATATS